MNTNIAKAVALEELQEIEARAAELRKIIEAPEVAPSLLTKPEPGSRAGYCAIYADTLGFRAGAANANSTHEPVYSHGNIFQTKELATAYADAINTMLLLRHQPGAVPASDCRQSVIRPTNGLVGLVVEHDQFLRLKIECLSPAFATGEDADRAIDTIGADRILRMFRVLHHIEE